MNHWRDPRGVSPPPNSPTGLENTIFQPYPYPDPNGQQASIPEEIITGVERLAVTNHYAIPLLNQFRGTISQQNLRTPTALSSQGPPTMSTPVTNPLSNSATGACRPSLVTTTSCNNRPVASNIGPPTGSVATPQPQTQGFVGQTSYGMTPPCPPAGITSFPPIGNVNRLITSQRVPYGGGLTPYAPSTSGYSQVGSSAPSPILSSPSVPQPSYTPPGVGVGSQVWLPYQSPYQPGIPFPGQAIPVPAHVVQVPAQSFSVPMAYPMPGQNVSFWPSQIPVQSTGSVSSAKPPRIPTIRFSGEDPSEANEFKDSVVEYQRAMRISETDLLDIMPLLFTGRARRWYRKIKSNVRSWRDFEHHFNQAYLDQFHNFKVRQQLYELKQKEEGSAVEYVRTMVDLYDQLSDQRKPTEVAMVDLIRCGLTPPYQAVLFSERIHTFRELERIIAEKTPFVQAFSSPSQPGPRERENIPYQGAKQNLPPTRDNNCFRCGEPGHFSRNCPQTPPNRRPFPVQSGNPPTTIAGIIADAPVEESFVGWWEPGEIKTPTDLPLDTVRETSPCIPVVDPKLGVSQVNPFTITRNKLLAEVESLLPTQLKEKFGNPPITVAPVVNPTVFRFTGGTDPHPRQAETILITMGKQDNTEYPLENSPSWASIIEGRPSYLPGITDPSPPPRYQVQESPRTEEERIRDLPHRDRVFVEVYWDKRWLKALVDTGSQLSYLDLETFQKTVPGFATDRLKVSRATLAANHYEVDRRGPVLQTMRLNSATGPEFEFPFYLLTKSAFPIILGHDWLCHMRATLDFNRALVTIHFSGYHWTFPLVTKTHEADPPTIGPKVTLPDSLPITSVQRQQLEELLNRYPKVFSDKPGLTKTLCHTIDTGDAKPIALRPNRTSPAEKKVIEEHIMAMLKDGVIRPSKGLWAAPMRVIPKKTGDTRPVVDYRELNKVTTKDHYSTANLEDIIEGVGSPQYITTLDLRSGYWQIPMDETSIEKTGFITHMGTFEFLKMPFGLSGAPATFQRMMDTVFPIQERKHHGLGIYLDDVVTAAPTWEKHLNDINYVLSTLQAEGLTVRHDKCNYAQEEILLLGHIVGKGGIRPNPEKSRALEGYPPPTNVKEVQRFLGFVGWFRKFIKNFSSIAAPLSQLKRKHQPFIWGKDQQVAFDTLRRALITEPILTVPVEGKAFTIHTDASSYGLGAVLLQDQETGPKVISYASRTLSEPEKNYTNTEKECLAVVWAVRKFRPYIEGLKFTVMTDHQALRWLLQLTDPQGRLARWALKLQGQDMNVIYRPGILNHLADSLSRNVPETTTPAVTSMERQGANQSPPGPYTGYQTGEAMSSPSMSPDANTCCENTSLLSRLFPLVDQTRERLFSRGPSAQSDNFIRTIHIDPLPEDPELHLRTKEEWRQAQREDEDIKPIFEQILDDPEGSRYQLINELVYLKARGEADTPKLVVPTQYYLPVLHTYHDAKFAGHMGVAKTCANINSRFFWKGMRRHITNYVKGCVICQRTKKERRRPPGYMMSTKVKGPWEMVGIDIMGPFPTSTTGNNYLLVMVDYFTKAIELSPLQTANAEEIARAFLDKVICRWNTPLRLFSDNGSQFISELIANTMKLLKIKHNFTSLYHPQSNLTERFNQNLGRLLGTYLGVDHTAWDQSLSLIRLALNSTPSEATGYTPLYLNYGREPRLPGDIPVDEPLLLETPTPEFVQNLQEDYNRVRKNLQLANEKNKHYYDARRREESYLVVGQLVWVLAHPQSRAAAGISRKLAPKFDGPYRVRQRLNELTYELEELGTTDVVGRFHISHLKIYHSQTWPVVPEIPPLTPGETESIRPGTSRVPDPEVDRPGPSQASVPVITGKKKRKSNEPLASIEPGKRRRRKRPHEKGEEKCDKDPCLISNTSIENPFWICCDRCEAWYHTHCLDREERSYQAEAFICHRCNPADYLFQIMASNSEPFEDPRNEEWRYELEWARALRAKIHYTRRAGARRTRYPRPGGRGLLGLLRRPEPKPKVVAIVPRSSFLEPTGLASPETVSFAQDQDEDEEPIMILHPEEPLDTEGPAPEMPGPSQPTPGPVTLAVRAPSRELAAAWTLPPLPERRLPSGEPILAAESNFPRGRERQRPEDRSQKACVRKLEELREMEGWHSQTPRHWECHSSLIDDPKHRAGIMRIQCGVCRHYGHPAEQCNPAAEMVQESSEPTQVTRATQTINAVDPRRNPFFEKN